VIVPRGSPTQLVGGRIIHRPARGFRFGPQRGTGWGRGAGLGWGWGHRGVGYVSPVGFADFGTFQTAAIASEPPCPPPFDPACENPRDARIAANLLEWKTNPQSCGVIVCDAGGNPAAGSSATPPATTTMPVTTLRRRPPPVSNAPPPSGGTPPTFGYPGYKMGGAGPAVIPQGYGYRPVPIQSASPAGAPGGPSAPPSAPTPVQTQAPPCDPSTDPTCPGYQAPATGFSLSDVPWWGWGLGVVALVLIARPGGKR
jgi:hypothetical protein